MQIKTITFLRDSKDVYNGVMTNYEKFTFLHGSAFQLNILV